jgi:imidazolonepropionase-like amidohydrolase
MQPARDRSTFRKLPLAFAIAALTLGTVQAADAPAAPAAAPAPALTVIHCAHLVDTVDGKLLGATSIVIDGQRIKEVVPGSVSRDGARVIEMPANDTCLPGLIDSHTHLTSQFSKQDQLQRPVQAEPRRLRDPEHGIRAAYTAGRVHHGA